MRAAIMGSSQRVEKPQSAMERDHSKESCLYRGEGTTAMMGTKLRTFAPQINRSLEELVLQNHFYRYLDQQLDLSFVRTFFLSWRRRAQQPEPTTARA